MAWHGTLGYLGQNACLCKSGLLGCNPQASLSERFDKIVVLPTSWAWEDCLHAYLTLDIAKVSRSNGVAWRLRATTAMHVDDITSELYSFVLPAGWHQQGP
jgi:hypothetical protein